MSINVSVIGGDLRQLSAANTLSNAGYDVQLSGFNPENEKIRSFGCDLAILQNIGEFEKDANICILPLPVSRDGEAVYAPLVGKNAKPILLRSLFENFPRNAVFFGGNVSEYTHRLAAEYNRKIIDYWQDEQLQVRNAVPTAEGAAAIAIQELKTTVAGSRCTVIGFGRVGKALGMTLVRLGAEVTVAARSTADRGWAKAFGCKTIPLEEYLIKPCDADIVYNTVPVTLLTEQVLCRYKSRPILVELASYPGIDSRSAEALGFRLIQAGGLPAKVAPVTAGRIIGETVLDLMPEEVRL